MSIFSNKQRFLELVCTLIALISAGSAFVYIASYRTFAIPYGDEWWDCAFIAILTKLGKIRFDDFFMYSHGHRLPVIRFITYLSTISTSWNLAILRFLPLAVNLAILLVLNLLLKSCGVKRLSRRISLAGSAIILFTLYHEASWLDYYFATWQLSNLFMITGVFIITSLRTSAAQLALVIISAAMSSLSISFGLASWASLPIAYLNKKRDFSKFYICSYFVSMALFVTLFFSPLSRSIHEFPISKKQEVVSSVSHYTAESAASLGQMIPKLKVAIAKIISLLDYSKIFSLLDYPGGRLNYHSKSESPLLSNMPSIDITWVQILISIVAIAIIFAVGYNLFNFLKTNSNPRTQLVFFPIVSLMSYSIIGSILLALGRTPSYPAVARYSPGSDLFWIAVVVFSVEIILSENTPRHSKITLLIAFASFYLLSLAKSTSTFLMTASSFPYSQACGNCARNPLKQSSCFKQCFHWGDEQINFVLAKMKLAHFSNANKIKTQPTKIPEDSIPIVLAPSALHGAYIAENYIDESYKKQIYIYNLGNKFRPTRYPRSPWHQDDWVPVLAKDSYLGRYLQFSSIELIPAERQLPKQLAILYPSNITPEDFNLSILAITANQKCTASTDNGTRLHANRESPVSTLLLLCKLNARGAE